MGASNTFQDRIDQAIRHHLSIKKLQKLDRKEMAKFCGVSVASVGQWINGDIKKELYSYPNSRAAQYLGVSPDWLAGNKDYPMLIDHHEQSQHPQLPKLAGILNKINELYENKQLTKEDLDRLDKSFEFNANSLLESLVTPKHLSQSEIEAQKTA